MQTNSSWKAAKVGPRRLSSVTMFSAGRVGTWAMCLPIWLVLFYFVFIVTIKCILPELCQIWKAVYCMGMGRIGGIPFFLKNPTALVSKQSSGTGTGPSSHCPASEIRTGKGYKLLWLCLVGVILLVNWLCPCPFVTFTARPVLINASRPWPLLGRLPRVA